MNAVSPIAPRIAKLLPRLATDHDGEVVATARAIERTLRAAGLDYHDLAKALESETKVVVVYRDRGNGDPETWADLARWCSTNDGGRLKPHERRFVHDMAHRFVLGGEPTEKQGAWMRALYVKLRRRPSQ